MEYLLTLLSTPDGGVILDPFAGSGTTLLAAQELGRCCIGVELDAHNCEIAAARIREADSKRAAALRFDYEALYEHSNPAACKRCPLKKSK